jgi:hypothetical protein
MVMTPPARLRGEQVVERLKQVGVATGTCLQYGDPCSGMGNEHTQEPITAISTEGGRIGSDIDCCRPGAGPNFNSLGLHRQDCARWA